MLQLPKTDFALICKSFVVRISLDWNVENDEPIWSWRVKIGRCSMEAENAIHRFDLGRLDEAGMRDRDRMQDAFERFLPEFQKRLQFWKIWAKVVVLPDVALQQPRMVRAPV